MNFVFKQHELTREHFSAETLRSCFSVQHGIGAFQSCMTKKVDYTDLHVIKIILAKPSLRHLIFHSGIEMSMMKFASHAQCNGGLFLLHRPNRTAKYLWNGEQSNVVWSDVYAFL